MKNYGNDTPESFLKGAIITAIVAMACAYGLAKVLLVLFNRF